MGTLRLLTICSLLFFEPAFAWSLFGPKSYDDCIIQNMKGVTSDYAASQISRACRSKFPPEIPRPEKQPAKCKTRLMSESELKKITYDKTNGGQFITDKGATLWDLLETKNNINKPFFRAEIRNENDLASAEVITFMISADNINPPQEYEVVEGLPIDPRSRKIISFNLNTEPEKNPRWWIKSVRTCVR